MKKKNIFVIWVILMVLWCIFVGTSCTKKELPVPQDTQKLSPKISPDRPIAEKFQATNNNSHESNI